MASSLVPRWLVFLQVVTCFGLPWSNIEPDHTVTPGLCETKFVVVDIKEISSIEDFIHVPYDVCLVDHPACYVSNNIKQPCDQEGGVPDQMNESILEAQLTDRNGNIIPLFHDDKHFNVSLKGQDFTMANVYNYTVSYSYRTNCDETIPVIHVIERLPCFGWIHLNLTIIVTNISLTVANDDNDLILVEDDNMKKFQVKEGASSVDLECSFRLASHQELDLRLKFFFTSAQSNGEKIEKNAWCDESNQNAENWVVTPNMDDNACHLKIVNFSEADGGQYDCLVILINSHTSYNADKSNTVFLAAEKKLEPPTKINYKNEFGQIEADVFYVLLSSIIVIVLAFSAIVVVVKVKRYYRFQVPLIVRRDRTPVPGRDSYGSTGSTRTQRSNRSCDNHKDEPILLNVTPSVTPYPTDIEGNDTEAETQFTGSDMDSTAASSLIDSERDDEALHSIPRPRPAKPYMSDTCAEKSGSSNDRNKREVMSESCDRRRSITTSRLKGLQYTPLGYKESRKTSRKSSQAERDASANNGAGSRSGEDGQGSSQESDQNVVLSLSDSDTGSSAGSSGKNSPDANK